MLTLDNIPRTLGEMDYPERRNVLWHANFRERSGDFVCPESRAPAVNQPGPSVLPTFEEHYPELLDRWTGGAGAGSRGLVGVCGKLHFPAHLSVEETSRLPPLT
jgi:hypothetical protein